LAFRGCVHIFMKISGLSFGFTLRVVIRFHLSILAQLANVQHNNLFLKGDFYEHL
jgi:hypothetical protein